MFFFSSFRILLVKCYHAAPLNSPNSSSNIHILWLVIWISNLRSFRQETAISKTRKKGITKAPRFSLSAPMLWIQRAEWPTEFCPSSLWESFTEWKNWGIASSQNKTKTEKKNLHLLTATRTEWPSYITSLLRCACTANNNCACSPGSHPFHKL